MLFPDVVKDFVPFACYVTPENGQHVLQNLRCVGNLSDQRLLNCRLDADDDKLKVTVDSLLLFGAKFTSGNEL